MMISDLKKSKIVKAIFINVLLIMFWEMVFPVTAFALTSGPQTPEFSSFTPVATSDMVDVFSGDFSYNLPVINVPGEYGGGYAMSLAYNGVGGVEDEASWVGLGWSLNPGSLNRNLRGFPDDLDGETIKYYSKTRRNWTVSMAERMTLEFFGSDADKSIGLSVNRSVRYNNYMGLVKSIGMGINVKGVGSLGIDVSGGEFTLNGKVDPALFMNQAKTQQSREDLECEMQNLSDAAGDDETTIVKCSVKKPEMENPTGAMIANMASTTGIFSYENNSKATTLSEYSGFAMNVDVSTTIPATVPVGPVPVGKSASFNFQNNQKSSEKKYHGYNYSKAYDGNNSTHMFDYFVEKANPFSKRQHFVGIPFNNADVFSAVGEGLSGGFQAHHTTIGQFYPNKIVNTSGNLALGVDLNTGNPVGIGVNLGFGVNVNSMGRWLAPDPNASGSKSAHKAYDPSYQFDDNAQVFYRFNNDMGGSLLYNNSGNPLDLQPAQLNVLSPIPGIKVVEPVFPGNGYTLSAANNRGILINSKKASVVKANPNASFSGNPIVLDASIKDESIAAYEIIKTDGARYAYELPVYNKDEVDLSVNIPENGNFSNDKNYKLYNKCASCSTNVNEVDPSMDNPDFSTMVGERRATAYASNYLLTNIFSPDYKDADGVAGPSEGDFGGWTKFSYNKKHGYQKSEWYKWRMPYNGYLYNLGSNSDVKDDLANFSTGKKEVYYLKAIETSTHIAFFVTNKSTSGTFQDITDRISNGSLSNAYLIPKSSSSRQDGLDASATNAGERDKKGSNELEYLDKIVLFSKKRMDVPIKTVQFSYSNKLTPGIPNSSSSGQSGGKLTLEKVWFEYEGVQNIKISPYVFKYEYKKAADFPKEIIDRYAFLGTGGDWPSYTASDENPAYSGFCVNAWGGYQGKLDGEKRRERQQPWMNQRSKSDIPKYDPAAWQLKQIILPSGGEILMQYEEDEYQYVQDREATTMVSLLANTVDEPNNDNRYYLNLDDIDIDDPQYLNQYRDLLDDFFIKKKNKIYFKFLYALTTNNPKLCDCKSEFITGYADVKSVNIDGTKIYVVLGSDGGSGILFPRKACDSYVTNGKLKKLESADCSNEYDDFDNGLAECDNAGDVAELVFLGKGGVNFMSIISALQVDLAFNFGGFRSCGDLSKDGSYLKVPVLKPKRGGGLRIKRLLTYDKGLENGDAQLFGQEYLYNDVNGKSFGVATNEPNSAREENVLVSFIPRLKQSFFNRLISGRDRTLVEGPIGESLLPGASVGYSKVIVKSIHNGVSSAGFVEHEFYTVKDYPFDKYYGGNINSRGVEYTSLEESTERDAINVPAGFLNYNADRVWLTQGFRFILNQMHGKSKSIATYGGAYLGSNYLSSKQESEYFEPGESVTGVKMAMVGEGEAAEMQFVSSQINPGLEEDVTMEMREVSDFAFDFGFELDIDILLCMPIVVYVTVGGWSISFNQSGIGTHSTSKVLRYPAILKKTTSTVDGVSHITQNVAFDEATGEPVYTRSYDEFNGTVSNGVTHDGTYNSLNLPAHWYYPAMGQKAQNAANTNQLMSSAGNITTYGENSDILTASDWKSKVVSASFQTYKDLGLLLSESVANDYGVAPPATPGDRYPVSTSYKPQNSYKYTGSILGSNRNSTYTARNIKKGGILSAFQLFDVNASHPECNPQVSDCITDGWQFMSKVTAYSPHGEPLEEMNALKIFSAARFPKDFSMPSIISQNATYNSIVFESFEHNSSLLAGDAHSGKKAAKVTGNSTIEFPVLVDSYLEAQGLLVNLWVKPLENTNNPMPAITVNDFSIGIAHGGIVQPGNVKRIIASVGGWYLIEAKISGINVVTSSGKPEACKVVFENRVTSANSFDVLIDDIKLQPFKSESKCFVYDPNTQRLQAEFLPSHFAVFYQYNDEGKLVRKLVETEKGIKTVQETQYNLPLVGR